jgi:hypothetical protein
MPDGDAADAEFGGECGTGDPVGIAGEELAEDQVFSGVHGAEGGRRRGGEGDRGRLEPGNENENENGNGNGNDWRGEWS